MSNSVISLLAPPLPFALSYLLLAVIPGVNFVLVADAGSSCCRTSALSAAFGVATGASCLSAVIALGAGAIFGGSAAREVIGLLFGCYLMVLALRSWRRARALRQSLTSRVAAPTRSHFRLAFLTAIANPATAMFVASAGPFASKDHAGWIAIALTVFTVAMLWFGLVALVTSSDGSRFFSHGLAAYQILVLALL